MRSLAFLLCLAFYQPASGQWQVLDIAATNTLTAVHFGTETFGFVCGGRYIFKTTNGGEDWNLCYQGADLYQLEDVKVIGNNTIIAAGYDFGASKSVVLRSTNSGTNWSEVAVSSQAYLKSICFVNEQLGYCAGGSEILKTTNGGASWTVQNPGLGGMVQAIFFTDALSGFAAGGSPVAAKMMKTNNGGQTWDVADIPDSASYLQSVCFVDPSIGYVVGWNGTILKTTDGGDTWFSQTSVNLQGNLEVFFTDQNTGYIAGGNFATTSVQKTVNGGDQWEEIGPNLNYGLVGIHFPSQETGYAVGANGTVIKTTTGGTSATAGASAPIKPVCTPNPVGNMLSVSVGYSEFRTIRVFDNNAVLLYQSEIESNRFDIDFINYPAGNYVVVFEGEGNRHLQKVIKL